MLAATRSDVECSGGKYCIIDITKVIIWDISPSIKMDDRSLTRATEKRQSNFLDFKK